MKTFLSAPRTVAVPERLTDLCAGRCDSLPAAITVRAGRVFFKANDGFSGDELWVSDGTPGSERRVRDVCPGPCSAAPGRVPSAPSLPI
jgi:ELWxxDGT repeat protein